MDHSSVRLGSHDEPIRNRHTVAATFHGDSFSNVTDAWYLGQLELVFDLHDDILAWKRCVVSEVVADGAILHCDISIN